MLMLHDFFRHYFDKKRPQLLEGPLTVLEGRSMMFTNQQQNCTSPVAAASHTTELLFDWHMS
jgi:hypothetical protein